MLEEDGSLAVRWRSGLGGSAWNSEQSVDIAIRGCNFVLFPLEAVLCTDLLEVVAEVWVFGQRRVSLIGVLS